MMNGMVHIDGHSEVVSMQNTALEQVCEVGLFINKGATPISPNY